MKKSALRKSSAAAIVRWVGCLLVLGAGLGQAEEARVLDQGTWIPVGYSIGGIWSIQQEGEARYLLLDEDFKTKKAPDLKIFLSPHALEDLGDRNALRGAVRVAVLEKPKGSQRYALPEDLDLVDYQTLLIHCERYSKLWGGASLEVTP